MADGLTHNEVPDRRTVLFYYHGRDGECMCLGTDESQDSDPCGGRERFAKRGMNVSGRRLPSMPELPRVRLSAASQTLYIGKLS